MISRHLFSNKSTVPLWAWATLALYNTLRLSGSVITRSGQALNDMQFILLLYLPQSIMLAFATHAIYTAIRHFKDDLVEPRRRLRVPFVLAMGLIVAVIVGSGFLYFLPNTVRIIYFGLIFLCVLYFNIATFRLHKDSPQLAVASLPMVSGNVSQLETRADKALFERLQLAMEHHQLYAKTGLTIRELAQSLPIQEYLLRRFINKKLHYSNFNQFLK